MLFPGQFTSDELLAEFKGKKLPGRMGNDKVTTLNLEIVKSDSEAEILLVKGSVPGARGATVIVRNAVKGA